MKLIQIRLPETEVERCGAIGIDFGTTNSLVAYFDGERVAVLADDSGKMVRSVIAHGDGQWIVGEKALAVPGYIGSIKRLLGTDKPEYIAKLLGLKFANGKINIGESWFSVVEIVSKMFLEFADLVRNSLGREINRAVITVPAYYDDVARQHTKEAATLAGFEVIRLVSEPTAAAYAYGIDKKCEGMYCIYDFGGGTFDLSLLSMQFGCFRVVGTRGDLLLGGDDIDSDIAELIGDRSKAFSGIVRKELLIHARRAKEALSVHDEYFLGDDKLLTIDELNRIAEPYVIRTMAIFDEMLGELGVDRVEGVVLVGGSTRLRAVHRALRAKGVRVYDDINPDEAVVCGAALRAHAIDMCSNSLLLDVTPLSLGIGIFGGGVERIVNRNSPIPISVTQVFTTHENMQTAIEFLVCQGESDRIENNRALARFVLRGIEPKMAGVPKILVTFSIDADGMLSVSAEDEATGLRHDVSVMPSYGLEDGAVDKKPVD